MVKRLFHYSGSLGGGDYHGFEANESVFMGLHSFRCWHRYWTKARAVSHGWALAWELESFPQFLVISVEAKDASQLTTV